MQVKSQLRRMKFSYLNSLWAETYFTLEILLMENIIHITFICCCDNDENLNMENTGKGL